MQQAVRYSPPAVAVDYPYPEPTARLLFRRWRRLRDMKRAMRLWGDPEVTRYISSQYRLNRPAVRAMLRAAIASQRRVGVSYWPMFSRFDGGFVGCCGVRRLVPDVDELELGFHIVYAAWGRGYATEAATRVIEHAFDVLGRDHLVAGHHPENAASARVLAKLGFEQVGLRFYPETGEDHPHYRLNRPR